MDTKGPIADEKHIEHGDLHQRKWSVQDAEANALGGLRTVEVGLDADAVKDTVELDAAEQKRILRKVDWRLIPLLTFLYLYVTPGPASAITDRDQYGLHRQVKHRECQDRGHVRRPQIAWLTIQCCVDGILSTLLSFGSAKQYCFEDSQTFNLDHHSPFQLGHRDDADGPGHHLSRSRRRPRHARRC